MWSNEKKQTTEWKLHPEGTFMAVCRDIYEEPNPKAGQINKYGKRTPDTRVVIEFLTEEPVEFNGKMEPSLIRVRFNPSWGEKSSLRQFVTSWAPALGKPDRCNPEDLIGRGAYVTVTHSQDYEDTEKKWANIVGIAPPPKGATIPLIPADFVRHKDKGSAPQAGQATNEPTDLPF